MGAVDMGLRRAADLDPAAPLRPSDPGLRERIEREIRERGPMPFARFMELALYDPEAGYYTRPEATDEPAGPGRGGDFLTAPESHPLFGWSVARHLEDVWTALDRPGQFVVREHGAGTGALAAGILDGLGRSGSDLGGAIRYQAVDASGARLAALAARLEAEGLAAALEPADDRPADGVILANELLDALPVHRVEGGRGGELLERYVELRDDGAFHEVAGPPSSGDLVARLDEEGIRLETGQVAEICLALDGWVGHATAPLARGELLVIDYGYPAAELYRPERGSTLRAYQGHRVHADPFTSIGRQDLTAHVDLTALEGAALASGLVPIGRTSQGRFLAGLGVGELLVGLQGDPTTTLASYLDAKSALVRMLDPRATGGFAVVGYGRELGEAPALRGFAG